jgi:hypothetical protein
MTTANEAEPKSRRRSRLLLGGVGAMLLACAITTSLGTLVTSGRSGVSSMWSGFLNSTGIGKLIELGSDQGLAELAEALGERWDPDPSIPSAGVGFETYSTLGNPEAEIWLAIEISYTGACDSTPNDPCEALVEELARIVFENYSRVDELTGIDISITNYADFGVVEFSDTLIEKALTIQEWRRELSTEDQPEALARLRTTLRHARENALQILAFGEAHGVIDRVTGAIELAQGPPGVPCGPVDGGEERLCAYPAGAG